MVGSVPVLHPEVQTVDEMLEGWRIQQLFGDLDHGTIEGRCQMCSPRSRCHDRPATYSPAHVSSRSHHAGPNSRVRLRRVPTNPDGSNARTILQIPQFRIWRLTGKFLRYHVVAQYISPTHPGELVTPGTQVKAFANWSSRLPWVPVRHGQWRLAVAASQVEHVSITVV